MDKNIDISKVPFKVGDYIKAPFTIREGFTRNCLCKVVELQYIDENKYIYEIENTAIKKRQKLNVDLKTIKENKIEKLFSSEKEVNEIIRYLSNPNEINLENDNYDLTDDYGFIDIGKVATIYKKFYFLKEDDILSKGEIEIYKKTKEILVNEISFVKSISNEDAEKLIKKFIAKSCRLVGYKRG